MNSLASRSARAMVAFLILLAMVLLHSPAPQGFAASSLADGEYTIDFEILKGDPKDDSTSLANGYWNKPATVFIKNSAITVRTVINKDAWVTAFSTKQGSSFTDTKVISRNADKDTRLVEFKVSSFDEDLVTSMTVDIPSQNYYHSYETRFRFYPDTLTLVKAAGPAATQAPTSESNESSTSEGEKASSSNASSKDNPSSSTSQQAGASSKPTSGQSSGSSGGGSTGSSGKSTSDSSDAGAGVSSNSSGASAGVSSDSSSQASTGASNDSSSANAGVSSDAGAGISSSSSTSNTDDNSSVSPVVNSEQPDTNDDASTGLQADEASQDDTASEQADELASAVETTDQLLAASEVESGTVAATLDEEAKKGGSATIVIVIIIGVLFIAGSISWILINRKRNNN